MENPYGRSSALHDPLPSGHKAVVSLCAISERPAVFVFRDRRTHGAFRTHSARSG